MQAQHLESRPLQVAVQPPRPAGLKRQPVFEPEFLGLILVAFPPRLPFGGIGAERLAGKFRQGRDGGPPDSLVFARHLADQHCRRLLAAAPAQGVEGCLPGADLRVGVGDDFFQAGDQALVGQRGQRLQCRRADAGPAHHQGSEQFVEEAVVAGGVHGRGQGEEHVGVVRPA